MADLETANILWRDDITPSSTAYGDVYFSIDNGVAESEFVFLQHNQLAARFANLKDSPASIFTIVETGFGTGLNFTLCLRLWQQHAPKNARLRYISIEKHPLRLADLARVYQPWPALSAYAEYWMASYPPLFPGMYLSPVCDGVELQLFFGDVLEALDELMESLHPNHQQRQHYIDAWFLDGFAPSKNPDMWSDALYAKMATLSTQGTTLATFTAAGMVRRGLKNAGFDVQKVAGFGRKREMTIGTFTTRQANTAQGRPPKNHTSTWYLGPTVSRPQRVAVIGAGIAGATIAHALAKRGVIVDVFDAEAAPASHGSGNPQGLIYAKLSHSDSPAARFVCNTLNYAQHFYATLLAQGYLRQDIDINLCGLLHLETEATIESLRHAFRDSPHLLEFLTPTEASQAANIALQKGAVHVKGGGWINPAGLCEALLKHPTIHCHYQCKVEGIEKDALSWRLYGQRYDQVVFATGSSHITFTDHLPIKPVRGQVTYLESKAPLTSLHKAICDEGYLAPSRLGRHCIGASFNLHDKDLTLNPQDQADNLGQLHRAIPSLDMAEISPAALTGRAAFRATTPDYLPIVGPIVDRQHFVTSFAKLAKNALQNIYCLPRHQEGLYVFQGLGSKGLSYAPLCAEHLASVMCGERSPLALSQQFLLHPARFLLRNIIRGKKIKF